MNTHMTCFPANKYVFSILTRFTGGGCGDALIPLDGADTDAWKLVQSASRCLGKVSLVSMRVHDVGSRRKSSLFLLERVRLRRGRFGSGLYPVLLVRAVRVVFCVQF